MLPNSQQIFEKLSKGAFISSNSVQEDIRLYYMCLQKDFFAYQEYYEGVGFHLESGDGYYYFSRKENKQITANKLNGLCKWIDRIAFLQTFDPSFAPGFSFRKSDILQSFPTNLQLKEYGNKLYVDKMTHEKIVDSLVNELVTMGFVELENETEGRYKVTMAFNYIESLMDLIQPENGEQNEIPE